MRDRLTELLPLVMVAAIVVVFQFTRSDAPGLPFLQPEPTAATRPSTPTARMLDPTPARRANTPAMLPLPVCDPSQPRFVGSLASLRTKLGPTMGEPVECERAVDSQGNTQQQTTRGLAYYRKQADAACFTNGWDHWAIEGKRGLIQWAGYTVDPPADASTVSNH